MVTAAAISGAVSSLAMPVSVSDAVDGSAAAGLVAEADRGSWLDLLGDGVADSADDVRAECGADCAAIIGLRPDSKAQRAAAGNINWIGLPLAGRVGTDRLAGGPAGSADEFSLFGDGLIGLVSVEYRSALATRLYEWKAAVSGEHESVEGGGQWQAQAVTSADASPAAQPDRPANAGERRMLVGEAIEFLRENRFWLLAGAVVALLLTLTFRALMAAPRRRAPALRERAATDRRAHSDRRGHVSRREQGDRRGGPPRRTNPVIVPPGTASGSPG